MTFEITGILFTVLCLASFVFAVLKFFKEKNRLLSSEEFLATYKRIYDSFAQQAGVPSVEKLKYSRIFPPSAFAIRRKLNLALTTDQKTLLHEYSLQVRRAHILLGLSIWFLTMAISIPLLALI